MTRAKQNEQTGLKFENLIQIENVGSDAQPRVEYGYRNDG
jgi:hypothetical protein